MKVAKKRILGITIIVTFLLLISLATTFLYGLTFSHPRYWKGTIERVALTQASLIESIFKLTARHSALNMTFEDLETTFEPVKGKLLVEFIRDEKQIWSNANLKFKRGELLKEVYIKPSESIRLYTYTPPEWSYLFFRWARNPGRWFEPSFDYVTFPFIWFFSTYMTSLLAIAYRMKSNYLEVDVLKVINDIEKRYHP